MVSRLAGGFIRWTLSRYYRFQVALELIATQKMLQVGQGSSLSAEHLEPLENNVNIVRKICHLFGSSL